MTNTARVHIKHVETLANDWGILKKTTLDYRRKNQEWPTLVTSADITRS